MKAGPKTSWNTKKWQYSLDIFGLRLWEIKIFRSNKRSVMNKHLWSLWGKNSTLDKIFRPTRLGWKPKNPNKVMTRNLYTSLRKEGLQGTVSHSAEFGPTAWTTLFFSVPCICQQLLLPRYLSFSTLWGLLTVFFRFSCPSVFWLSFPFLCASADSVSAPLEEQAISRGYPGTTNTP